MRTSAGVHRSSRGSQSGRWQPVQRAASNTSDAKSASNVALQPKGHQFANVSVMPVEHYDLSEDEQLAESPELLELLERALSRPADTLPYRQYLEQQFGQSLEHIQIHSGPEAAALLDELGAEAATAGDRILLGGDRPNLSTIAHEVVHVLQGKPGVEAQVSRIVPTNAPIEAEAARISRNVVAERRDEELDEPLQPESRLALGSLALQRSDLIPEPSGGGTALLEPPEPQPAPEPAREAEPAVAAEQQPAQPNGMSLLPEFESEGAEAPEWELPAAPEPGVTPEDVAARQAALAEAEAALRGAGDVTGYMDDFASAPPTLKARNQDNVGDNLDNLVKQDAESFEQSLPDFHAQLNTEAEPVEPVEIRPPQAGAVELEPGQVEPAPVPDLPPTPDLGQYTENSGIARWLDFLSPDEPSGSQRQIDESLSSVRTTDPEIPQPGPPPAIELREETETDPERIQNQYEEGIGQSRERRDEAQGAVLNGPGPEQVQPVQMDEVYTVDALPVPAVDGPTPSSDAQAFLELGLPDDVQTAFDQEHQAAMESSMEEARAKVATSAAEHSEERQKAVAETEEKAREESQQTDEQQRNAVMTARQTIQTERQSTLDAQGQAVADLEADGDRQKREDHKRINDRVTEDQGKIDDKYDDAEKDVDNEVADGERKAEQEKRDAEKKSENQSWWERAKSFVKDAFNALVNAISAVFAALRNAVNKILDAVKEATMALINAAASFVKEAIKGFGEFLKAGVTALIGGVFPELAEKLNNSIDSAVNVATDFVDQAAEKLKAGVAALVDGLKAGLNKLLDVLEAGLTLAVSFVQAALTGDWSDFLKKALEAILKVIGINPEEFYAFVGRAEETFKITIDAPGQFLRNVLDAFTGGVRLFADNFLTHLQAGIIGWLTGALGSAGLQIPQQFDLMGVLSLVQQILGLTWAWLREKAVKLVGEQNVQRFEYILSWVQTLVTEGWSGVWERIKGELASLRDQVFDAIKTYIVERVVLAAITKLASLFNPVGAVVQLVLTAWNLYTFLRDQLQRIIQVVRTVIDAIGDIARGILGPAMNKVEEVLVSLLPLAIDLLARLMGLGNIGKKVQEMLQRVRTAVDQAIAKLIERVMAMFGRGEPEAVAPAAAPAGQIGERLPINLESGETHHLWIAVSGVDATLTVGSSPQTLAQQLENWRGRLGELGPEQSTEAGSLIQSAQASLSTADTSADRLAAAQADAGQAPTTGDGSAPQEETLSQAQRDLVLILAKLYLLFAQPLTSVSRRFELAQSVTGFQQGFSEQDWHEHFNKPGAALSEQQAQSDLQWGREQGRLEEVVAGGNQYRLMLGIPELVAIVTRELRVLGRTSEALGPADQPFGVDRVRNFCISNERLPSEPGRYTAEVLGLIADFLVQEGEVLRKEADLFIFAEMPTPPEFRHRGGPVDNWGRAVSYLGDPISFASYRKGESARKDPPGQFILKGISGVPAYHRGHLLARVLGGPNDLLNLVPLSRSSNLSMFHTAEKGVRDLIKDQLARPLNAYEYNVSVDYPRPSGLAAALNSLGVAAVDPAVTRLFTLARNNADLTKSQILSQAIVAPGTDGASIIPEQLLDVRRKLALDFMPESVSISVRAIQGQDPQQETYTIENHMGVSL
jgi:vacuolar-type H+-ATPase subunit E/Vma4